MLTNKGEIYYATFIYKVKAGRKDFEVETKSTVAIGREDEAWARIKKRDKKFLKEVRIKLIKKIGITSIKD